MPNKKYKTNMTKSIDAEEALDVTNAEIQEQIFEPEPITELIGKVAKCQLLCLRQEPNNSAAVVRFLESGSEVTIHADKSTDEWYAVTADGIDGFCVKSYISI